MCPVPGSSSDVPLADDDALILRNLTGIMSDARTALPTFSLDAFPNTDWSPDTRSGLNDPYITDYCNAKGSLAAFRRGEEWKKRAFSAITSASRNEVGVIRIGLDE